MAGLKAHHRLFARKTTTVLGKRLPIADPTEGLQTRLSRKGEKENAVEKKPGWQKNWKAKTPVKCLSRESARSFFV